VNWHEDELLSTRGNFEDQLAQVEVRHNEILRFCLHERSECGESQIVPFYDTQTKLWEVGRAGSEDCNSLRATENGRNISSSLNSDGPRQVGKEFTNCVCSRYDNMSRKTTPPMQRLDTFTPVSLSRVS
jgi:hypothetical protein